MFTRSAFLHLDAPPQETCAQDASEAGSLPCCCATYALYDRFGDLLYIGKSTNLRSRIRGHLRQPARRRSGIRQGRGIAAIEARPACSETEALLVEANLIAKLRPPFNKQMRSWSRYCYIVAVEERPLQLSISREADPWRQCFGPFRTRRQAVDIIEAIFWSCVQNRENRDLRRQCIALLTGRDSMLIHTMEQSHDAGRLDARSREKYVGILKEAFTRCSLLRHAESLLNGLLVLPGPNPSRTIIVMSRRDLLLHRLEPNAKAASRLLEDYQHMLADRSPWPSQKLPRATSDCFCVAAQAIRHAEADHRFISADVACHLSARQLLAMTFSQND